MTPPTYIEGFHDPEAVKRMTYQPLGNTGLQVSRFSFGGGPLGGYYGATEEEELVQMVRLALKSGINYIDTAPFYGDGRSEEVLGKALRGVPRGAYYIGTKVGRYEPNVARMFDFSAARVAASVDRSLNLLGLDYVDVIQVHDVEFAANIEIILEETLPAVQKVVDQGKARFIGVTGYPVSLLKEVVERSTVKIDMVLSYARYTLIDQTLKDFIPFFKSRGLGVVCACAVAMRLLCDGTVPKPHPAQQEIKDACEAALEYCKAAGCDLARLAVQFTVNLEGVDTFLMGSNNRAIFRSNLDSFLTPLTPREQQLTAEVQQKFFEPLPKKHWEGRGEELYWRELRSLRGDSPAPPANQ